MCLRIRHMSMEKTCVYGQHMCIWQHMYLRTRYEYMDKTCVYGQDMCIQTTHEYVDNPFRIVCPMLLYISYDKNDVYCVFISTQ